MQFMSIIWQS